MKTRGHNGFTIVELLIVIVVIGILAAITIVAFNGVQQRANNAAKFQAAANYEKSIQLYATQNGSFPPMGGGSVCLGQGYTIRGSDTVGTCGGSDYTTEEDVTFNTALKTVLSRIPDANNKVVRKADGTTFVGVTLTNWDGFRVNGQPNPYILQFVLEGQNQDCNVPGVVEMIDEEWANFRPATTQKFTFSDPVSTTCVVALPSPS